MQKYFLFNTVFIFSLLYRIKYIHPPVCFSPGANFFLPPLCRFATLKWQNGFSRSAASYFQFMRRCFFSAPGVPITSRFVSAALFFLLPVSLLLPHKFLKWRCILSPLCGKSARFGRLFASFLTILVLFPVLCYTSSQYAAYFSCDKAAPGIRIPLFLRRPWAVSFFAFAFFPGLPDGIIILSQRKCI